MPINILMPALSPTMEKGNLAKWLKKEGDAVKAGDVIAEIETDKATMEVEAVEEGTIGKILVPDGTADVAVNQPIAVLLEDGEDAASIGDAAAAPVPAKDEPKAETQKAEAEKPAAREADPPKADAPKADTVSPAPAPATKTNGTRIFASPLARRVAKERGIELSAVKGSGPHGRIVVRDLEGVQSGAKTPAAASHAGTPGAIPQIGDDRILGLFEEGSYEVVPHSAMRRTIATRMQESKIVVPHYYLAVDVELDALLKLRSELNAAAPKNDAGDPEWRVSVNDMVIRALALTLKKHPQANSTWTEGGMLRHKSVDIGVAVALEDGLITPIMRSAETKSLSQISVEMAELAGRARNKRLAPHEYQGGTTAISNLGMYGVKHFTAVVNPPHSTILAVAAGEKRPVVRGDAIEIATVMTVTVSCDHRVLNGAESAEMMQTFKRHIEKPFSLLM